MKVKIFILISLLLISFLGATEVSASQPTVEFVNTTIADNGVFELYINFKDIPEFCYYTISLEYENFEILTYNSSLPNTFFGNDRRGEFRISYSSNQNKVVEQEVVKLTCWVEDADKINFHGSFEEIGDDSFKNDFSKDILTKQLINKNFNDCIHEYSTELSKINSDCINKGLLVKECSICKKSTCEAELPYTEHSEGDWVTEKESSCTELGLKHKYCLICEKLLKSEETTMKLHSPGEWQEVTPSDCKTQGMRVKKCTLCLAEIESELLPLTQHKYVDKVTAPTYTSQGYTTHICEVCEYQYIDNYTPKLVMSIGGGGSGGGGSAFVPQKPTTPQIVIVGASDSAKSNKIIPEILSNKKMSEAVTREEFAEVAVKVYEALSKNKIELKDNPFVDTDNSNVIKAYSLGITLGISENEFAPDNFLTREQLVTMLYRVLNVLDKKLKEAQNVAFDDEYYFDDWAREPIRMLTNAGVIKGVGDNLFAAFEFGTREHSIAVANRIVELLK